MVHVKEHCEKDTLRVLTAQFNTHVKSGIVKSVIISRCFQKNMASLFEGKQQAEKAHTGRNQVESKFQTRSESTQG